MGVDIVLEVGVKAFIARPDGKYLLLKRAKPYQGETIQRWDIPGGRIKPGEATLDALKREVKEETGLDLGQIIKILAVQDIQRVQGKHVVRITYLVACKDLETVALDPNEHSDHQWLSLEEVKQAPHDIYLVPVIETLTTELS